MLNTRLRAKFVALFPEQMAEIERGFGPPAPDPLAEGLAAYAAGDWAAALPRLRAAVEAQPFLVQAWIPLGLIHLAEGRLHEAEEQFFQALCLDAENPAIHYHLGEVAIVKRDGITAEYCFRRTISLDPSHTDAVIRLAMLLYDEDRLDEALKEFERAVYLDRRAVVAHFYLARISLARDDLKRALVQLHLVKSLKPDYAPAYLMAAEIFERIKDHRQVAIELKKAVGLGAATGDLYLRLGRTQLKVKDREGALAFFLEARSLDPGCHEASYHAATLQEDMNYLEPALSSYRSLLGARKYREIAQMGILRLTGMLAGMRQAMAGPTDGSPFGALPA